MAGPGIFMGGSCDPCCGEASCFSNNSLLSSDYTSEFDWQCLVNTTVLVSEKSDFLVEIIDTAGTVLGSQNVDGDFVDLAPVVTDTTDSEQKAGHFYYKENTVTVLNPVFTDNGDGLYTKTTETVTRITQTTELRRLSALADISQLIHPDATDRMGGKVTHDLRWHSVFSKVVDDKEDIGSYYNPMRAAVLGMSNANQWGFPDSPSSMGISLDHHPVDAQEFDNEMSSKSAASVFSYEHESARLHGAVEVVPEGAITKLDRENPYREYGLTNAESRDTSGTGSGAAYSYRDTASDRPYWQGSGYSVGDSLEIISPYSDFQTFSDGISTLDTANVLEVTGKVHEGKIVLMWGPLSESLNGRDPDQYYGFEVTDLYVEATPQVTKVVDHLYHRYSMRYPATYPHAVQCPDLMSLSRSWTRIDKNSWESNFTVNTENLHLYLGQFGLFHGPDGPDEEVRIQLYSGDTVAFERTWKYKEESDSVWYKAYRSVRTNSRGPDNGSLNTPDSDVSDEDWFFLSHRPCHHHPMIDPLGYDDSSQREYSWELAARHLGDAPDALPDDQFHEHVYSGDSFEIYSDGDGGKVIHADGLIPNKMPHAMRPGNGWFVENQTDAMTTRPSHVPSNNPETIFSVDSFPIHFTNRDIGLEVNAGTNAGDGYYSAYQMYVSEAGEGAGAVDSGKTFSFESPCPLHSHKINGSGYKIRIDVSSERVIPYLSVWVTTVLDASESNGCPEQHACAYTPTKSVADWGGFDVIDQNGSTPQSHIAGFITNGCSTKAYPSHLFSTWSHWGREAHEEFFSGDSNVFTSHGSIQVVNLLNYAYETPIPLYTSTEGFLYVTGTPPLDGASCTAVHHDEFVISGYGTVFGYYNRVSVYCEDPDITHSYFFSKAPDSSSVVSGFNMNPYAHFRHTVSQDVGHEWGILISPQRYSFSPITIDLTNGYAESFTLQLDDSSEHVSKDDHLGIKCMREFGYLYRDPLQGLVSAQNQFSKYFSIGSNILHPYAGVAYTGRLYQDSSAGDYYEGRFFWEDSYTGNLGGFTKDIFFRIHSSQLSQKKKVSPVGYTDDPLVFSIGFKGVYDSLSFAQQTELQSKLTKLKEDGSDVYFLDSGDVSQLKQICKQAYSWLKDDPTYAIDYWFRMYEVEVEVSDDGSVEVTSEEFTWCRVDALGFEEVDISDSDALEGKIDKSEFTDIVMHTNYEFYGIEGKYHDYSYCSEIGEITIPGIIPGFDITETGCVEYSYYPTPVENFSYIDYRDPISVETELIRGDYNPFTNEFNITQSLWEKLTTAWPYRGEGMDVYSSFRRLTDEQRSQTHDSIKSFSLLDGYTHLRNDGGKIGEVFPTNAFSYDLDTSDPPWSPRVNCFLGDSDLTVCSPEGSVGWEFLNESHSGLKTVSAPSRYYESTTDARRIHSRDRSDVTITGYASPSQCAPSTYPIYQDNESSFNHYVGSGFMEDVPTSSAQDMNVSPCGASSPITNIGTTSAWGNINWWNPRVPMMESDSSLVATGNFFTVEHKIQNYPANATSVPVMWMQTKHRSDLLGAASGISGDEQTCVHLSIDGGQHYTRDDYETFSDNPHFGEENLFYYGFCLLVSEIQTRTGTFTYSGDPMELFNIEESPDVHGNKVNSLEYGVTPVYNKVLSPTSFGPATYMARDNDGVDVIAGNNGGSLTPLRSLAVGDDPDALHGGYACGVIFCFPSHEFESELITTYPIEGYLTRPDDCVVIDSDCDPLLNDFCDDEPVPCYDPDEDVKATIETHSAIIPKDLGFSGYTKSV
jgi:hypothetical protein